MRTHPSSDAHPVLLHRLSCDLPPHRVWGVLLGSSLHTSLGLVHLGGRLDQAAVFLIVPGCPESYCTGPQASASSAGDGG